MRWVLDFGESVGQEHLDVPVAAEVAVALELVDVLDALVAEVSNDDLWVEGTEVRKDRHRARSFVVDNPFAHELAVWPDAAFIAGLRGVFEAFAYCWRHALLECPWS